MVDNERETEKSFADLPLEELLKDPTPTQWVHLLPTGQFRHPHYGLLILDRPTLAKMKERFDAGLLGRQVPVNLEHQYTTEGAAGWVKALEVRPEGLFGLIEWTDLGRQAIAGKRFKYISVELGPAYDPATGRYLEYLLTGVALTNRPFFKNLTPLTAAEPRWTVNSDPLNLPLDSDEERSWDAQESEKRWRQWVSPDDPHQWEGDEWRRYRKRFLVYDESHPYVLEGYKLPVADIVAGSPRLIKRGVIAAIAALSGARKGVNLPDSVIKEALQLARQCVERFSEGGAITMSDQYSDPKPLDPSRIIRLEHQVRHLQDLQRREILFRSLQTMRFSDGKAALSPKACERLAEALIQVSEPVARQILDALSELQLIPLGEIGFSSVTEPDGDFVAIVRRIADQKNLSIAEALKEAAAQRPDLAAQYYRFRL
ncbi:MAG: phage protease [Armatimonadetes bacterium]|nr:phage protease [Armatimonadota bacterium]MDW8122438.1 phage protease [Armatimonadota bacterium]